METGHLVRWTIEPVNRPKRRADERMALAMPWMQRALAALAMRRPAGTRIRRAALTYALSLGAAANNRGDYEFALSGYRSDAELIPPLVDGEPALGFEPVYRGRAGIQRFFEQWKSAFGLHRYEVHEVADPGGQRFATRMSLGGTIHDSDIELREEVAVIIEIRGGLVVRMETFRAWEDALAALG